MTESEEKISCLLNDNQIIMSQIDSICSIGTKKLDKLNLRALKQKFTSFNLKKLIQNSSKLKEEVNQNDGKLKLSVELKPMNLGEYR